MSLKFVVLCFIVAGAILSNSGCALFKTKNEVKVVEIFTEVQKKVDIDKRLLEKCPTFTKELKSGSDSEVVMWAREALKAASDCRKAQHKLADEVIKIFEIQ